MKNIVKILLFGFLLFFSRLATAQPLPTQHGGGGGLWVGGQAPIDGGTSLLIVMCSIYGGIKTYQFKRSRKQSANPS